MKNIKTTLVEYLNEQILTDESKANLQLSKFKNRKDFANKTFTLLNSGTGRSVYLIGNEYVLKVAKNNKGIEQNKKEIEISNVGIYKDIIANVIEYDKNGFYVVSQKADEISDELFNDVTGLQLQGFLYYLRLDKKWDGDNKEFYNKVNSLIKKFDLDRFDIANESSWGILNGKAVIIDYGLDGTTARNLYGVKY